MLVLSIYTLTICHSATLQENLQSAVQNVMLNGINMTLRLLKEEYQQKIHQLKTEAMSCAIHGSCSNILKKFEVRHCHVRFKYFNKIASWFVQQHLKNDFYQDLEKSKNYEKRTLQIYHRQNNIRCIDCITDYIDDIFSEFCDEMDEELEPDSKTQ